MRERWMAGWAGGDCGTTRGTRVSSRTACWAVKAWARHERVAPRHRRAPGLSTAQRMQRRAPRGHALQHSTMGARPAWQHALALASLVSAELMRLSRLLLLRSFRPKGPPEAPAGRGKRGVGVSASARHLLGSRVPGNSRPDAGRAGAAPCRAAATTCAQNQAQSCSKRATRAPSTVPKHTEHLFTRSPPPYPHHASTPGPHPPGLGASRSSSRKPSGSCRSLWEVAATGGTGEGGAWLAEQASDTLLLISTGGAAEVCRRRRWLRAVGYGRVGRGAGGEAAGWAGLQAGQGGGPAG